MQYTVKFTNQFKKDYKQAMKQKKQIKVLDDIITSLAKGETLSEKYTDHD